jgi:thiol:disulfide interchange protein
MKKIISIIALGLMVSFLGCKTHQTVIKDTAGNTTEKTIDESEVVKTTPAEQGVNFFEGTLEEGIAKAKAENKLLFVDCYTTWCGPCQMMKKYTFKDADLGEFMSEKYVCMAVNMEDTEGTVVGQKYPVPAFPTLLFLDKTGRLIHGQSGSVSASTLLNLAKETAQSNWQ